MVLENIRSKNNISPFILLIEGIILEAKKDCKELKMIYQGLDNILRLIIHLAKG